MKEQRSTSHATDEDKAPKISVIVPVYNVEKYLRQCLDSILAQTFTDFELLLIDDGSPDTSGTICDEYAALDSRVRVFHKENGGVSAARNVGLDNARGEYVTFSDSDDWMETNWLQCMVEAMEGTDMVISGHIRHNKIKNIIEPQEIEEGLHTKEAYSDICFKLMARGLLGYIWAMMFRNSIFQTYNIRFNPQIRYQEDLEMALRYITHTESFRTISACTYHYSFEKRFYEHKLQGIITISEAISNVLQGENKNKWLCRYAQSSVFVLLRHCSKDNYYITRKILKSVPQVFHGRTIGPVRRIVYTFPFWLGCPMIKAIYHTRRVKQKLFGGGPSYSIENW